MLAAKLENASETSNKELAPLQESKSSSWLSWGVLGPGLLCCLADTDAACLIVAAQSGYRWGYSLLLLQVVLIPILFLAQELTIRLGVYTQQGHTACIKKHYGSFWATTACALLVLECIAAMMSEMSGIAAVGELWGLSRTVATFAAAFIVVTAVFCLRYSQIEVIGVSLGLCELTFVLTMFLFHPSPAEVFTGARTFHDDPKFLSLVTANIGAVIMPWMIYFQQSAVVARGMVTAEDVRQERSATLIGSVLTQLVMIGTLVSLAAARSKAKNIKTVLDIVDAMAPVLGWQASRVLVSLGFLGGSLCAAFVVSLAAAWAVGEAVGADVSVALDQPPMKAPGFYCSFLAVVVLGIIVLLTGVNEVRLNILVLVLDGLLLPFAVGFLYLLATGEALPEEVRITGSHKYMLAVIFGCCTLLSLGSMAYAALVGDDD